MRFIAVIEGSFIRDAQVYAGDPAIIENVSFEHDNTFLDLKHPRHLVGIFDGMCEEEVVRIAANQQGVHPCAITLIPLDDMGDEACDMDGIEERLVLWYRWLRRRKFRDKSYMLTRDNLRINHRIEYYGYETCAYIEIWFDVSKRLGLKLSIGEYINVHAHISCDDVRLSYVINYEDGLTDYERPFCRLSQSEKDVIRAMANEISLLEDKKTVDEILAELMPQ